MAARAHQAAFSAFVTAHRPALLQVAVLVHDRAEIAERLVEQALAELYVGWRRIPAPQVYAFRGVLDLGRLEHVAPWRDRPRFELVDGLATTPRTAGAVLTDLRTLSAPQRTVLVLSSVGGLDNEVVAAVIEQDPKVVGRLLLESRRRLASTDRSRSQPNVLEAQLTAAAWALAPQPGTTDTDLAHGVALRRGRRVRVAAWLAAAVVVVGLIVVPQTPPATEVAGTEPTPRPEPAVSISPTPDPTADCDVSAPACRSATVWSWREETARIALSHLDPGEEYFSGYRHAGSDRFDSGDYWRGAGGAVGLDLVRDRSGATEVYLQVATSRRDAVTCGELTGQTCNGIRFMDGNRFTLTQSTTVDRGIEVQHAPSGTYVITAVARNTSAGRPLELGLGDLIELVQDQRLRLPPR